EAYAQQYRDLVAQVRAEEDKAGLGDAFTTAVAKFAYKLMAYKDEYEVARLYTDGTFEKKLRETFHGGKIEFHLAPPLMAKKDSNGHLKKKRFGPWMKTAFSLLRRFKGLRGTRFDLFGYTEERKMERKLRDDYLKNVVKLAEGLNKKNHELAVAIASIPDEIRGYGHVKEASVEAAKSHAEELWQNWPKGGLPKSKTTLIAAE
ncbi:MAG: indolepyruvate ferredoxin oxidoreductase family protein, partial [Henriciella sp.]